MIHIYVKISPKGLKYLGKTTKDPLKYKGSGKLWRRHLRKHNLSSTDIETNILFSSNDKEEIRKMGIYFSEQFDIVNSGEWANFRLEIGDGGDTSMFIDYSKREMNHEKTTSHPNYIATRTYKQLHTKEARDKARSNWMNSNAPIKCAEHLKRVSSSKVKCSICGKETSPGNHKRWHGQKCRGKSI